MDIHLSLLILPLLLMADNVTLSGAYLSFVLVQASMWWVGGTAITLVFIVWSCGCFNKLEYVFPPLPLLRIGMMLVSLPADWLLTGSRWAVCASGMARLPKPGRGRGQGRGQHVPCRHQCANRGPRS